MGSLRQDPRVINLERTNISDEKLLSLEPRPTLGSVDLSYLSLLRGVPAFSAVLHGQGELVCLVNGRLGNSEEYDKAFERFIK